VEPEIPPNTGNIARTCAATGTVLHLVEPLGFSLDDRYLKRAGVDYWHLVRVVVHPNWESARRALEGAGAFHLFTSHGGLKYSEVSYGADDVLVFGCESRGLPDDILSSYPQAWRIIPMTSAVRSLNLSNAVAIAVYEAQRQLGFPLGTV
jgi:tRNA (cytidine/uridine-2'-O-)-methyltransferase